MFQKKYIITVKKAAKQVFKEMPDTFSAVTFSNRVKLLVGSDRLMDGTILRKLREARTDNPEFEYQCIDRERAIYKKTNNLMLNDK